MFASHLVIQMVVYHIIMNTKLFLKTKYQIEKNALIWNLALMEQYNLEFHKQCIFCFIYQII